MAPELLFVGSLSTVADTMAAFEIDGQLAAVAVADSVTVRVDPAVMSPNVHVSVVPTASGDAGEHLPASVPPIVQVRPLGSTSVMTTPVAGTVPEAVTTIEYRAVPPAVTLGVLVVFFFFTSGHFTAIFTGPE